MKFLSLLVIIIMKEVQISHPQPSPFPAQNGRLKHDPERKNYFA